MEFNKCPRCGSFFAYSGNTCPNCIEKDNIKINKINNYIQNYSTPNSIDELSVNTGITSNDLTRLINSSGLDFKL